MHTEAALGLLGTIMGDFYRNLAALKEGGFRDVFFCVVSALHMGPWCQKIWLFVPVKLAVDAAGCNQPEDVSAKAHFSSGFWMWKTAPVLPVGNRR